MRVVIVGAGEVGTNTARMLSGEGHRVVVIDQDEALVERTGQHLDALVMHGNGARPRVLREAEVENADLLIAVTNTDEVNIVACPAAKSQGVPRTVVRIHNPDYHDPKKPFSKDILGMDFVIRTEQMVADEISSVLLVPGAVNVETFADGTIEVVEVILKEDSPAVRRAVSDVNLPKRSLIVGVVRDGKPLIPRGDTVLEARDHVFMICERRRVSEVVGAVVTDASPVETL